MSGGKFDHPARKLHARDICKLQNIGDQWHFREDGISFNVRLIWVQGKVVSYNLNKSEVILDDGGFKINISNCQNIPGGNSWIMEGQYVMVVGEIEEVASSRVVRAIKMADLSTNVVHQTMWNHEVTEVKMLLKENQSMCR
nr:recQ-mediated genome instability protein 2-like isoform X1 [Procambarus clarkii]XP_045604454.1 recQ-mediated genome instability protein 2-like isoform X1 [Procambarus clarkii]XP_045604455.1 recQ-mediated genome instability protein 2-like isoform X1 [Procambarus clarkii]XP_045604456.1 recQ-mediated genome instability protein 2-like isoform X1 [Procambarus clarkii]